ncbi:MAG: hypothetical protein ACKVHU_03705 [Acidimicrobiales bacterium]
MDPVEGFISGYVLEIAALMRALEEDPNIAEVRGPVDPAKDALRS